jgi:hypothetical protein
MSDVDEAAFYAGAGLLIYTHSGLVSAGGFLFGVGLLSVLIDRSGSDE